MSPNGHGMPSVPTLIAALQDGEPQRPWYAPSEWVYHRQNIY